MEETSQNRNQQIAAGEIEDAYMLTEFDQPMTALTHEPFNGKNYLAWSREVRAALRFKRKLGFIDGSLPEPPAADPNHERWIMCNCMVWCWLMSSMTPELSKSFVFAKSARQMWSDISVIHKPSYGNLLYQLSQISQGDSSVASYFAELKRCWKDLEDLAALSTTNRDKTDLCTCDCAGKFQKHMDENRLMRFLLKLSDEFNAVKWQILCTDPLPSVKDAFHSVLKVEAQNLAMQKTVESGEISSRNNFCSHCKKKGHVKDQCFDIIGYPDWFKAKRNRNRRPC